MSSPLRPLLRLQHVVRAEMRDALAELDLTPVQNTVLRMITRRPGSSSAELARKTQVTPQTMHKLVSDLADRGLLTLRPRAGHGRILEAQITDEGADLLRDARRRTEALERRMVTGFDKSERDQLAELLERCVAALDGPPEY